MKQDMKTFEEIAADFRAAGVAVGDGAVTNAQNIWDSMPKEVQEDNVDDKPSFLFYGLYGVSGDSGTFRILSENLFAFDWEVEDPYCMFADFLACVNKINDGAFVLTDIKQEVPDFSSIEELESYPKKVTFGLNGTRYEYEAATEYDWFDGEIIEWFNDVLSQQGFSGRLYCFSSDMCCIFYGSEEWAKQFAQKTGMTLK